MDLPHFAVVCINKKSCSELRAENTKLREILKEAIEGIIFLSRTAGVYQEDWENWSVRAREALNKHNQV